MMAGHSPSVWCGRIVRRGLGRRDEEKKRRSTAILRDARRPIGYMGRRRVSGPAPHETPALAAASTGRMQTMRYILNTTG